MRTAQSTYDVVILKAGHNGLVAAAYLGTWGVDTEFENVFFCGASAQRGGGVSGIPGHNAAMKVLACLGLDHR